MEPLQNSNYQPFPIMNLSVAPQPQQPQQFERFQTLISNSQSYDSWGMQGDRAPLLQQGYMGGMSMGSIPPGPPDIMEDNFQAQDPGMEAAYTAYQTALKEIFQNIINGRLGEASQSLLEVSEWLLGHVGDLGRYSFLLFDPAY
jgi:hypothetical protein